MVEILGVLEKRHGFCSTIILQPYITSCGFKQNVQK